MIDKKFFDNYNGQNCYLYVLHGNGIEVGITDFGAAVQYIRLHTQNGIKDIALGYPTIEERIKSGTYCGATIGRVANRISGAGFSLNGKKYSLSANDGQNTNHGGKEGFDKRLFKAKRLGNMLQLTLKSPSGDMGFPANLKLKVQFKLKGKQLSVKYLAKSDGDTLWCPTCHTYFNLDGGGTALNNKIKINGQSFLPIGGGLIPTGQILPVAKTPFDFTEFKPLGRDIDGKDEQLKLGSGFDHSFILNGSHAASVESSSGDIKLDIFTDMPCVQLYSGNFIGGNGVNGRLSPRYGFALEPQTVPNAINMPQFTAPVLKAGKTQTYYIRYGFDF